jgi:UDP-glucose 4-epimerase
MLTDVTIHSRGDRWMTNGPTATNGSMTNGSRTKCWLVTGGAGYIGAHVVGVLRRAGLRVVVLDDLSAGHLDRIPGVEFVPGCVLDSTLLVDTMRRHGVAGVVHAAARKDVAESFADPAGYHRTNVDGLRTVLAAMQVSGVNRIVYSSSAAVYGQGGSGPLTEAMAGDPLSPYGRTKQVGELLLAERARTDGLRYVGLRYFNVAGAARPQLADTTGRSLISTLWRSVAAGRSPVVYGTDHPTPDGTCVRDYVHVQDVAEAHLAVLPLLEQAGCAATFNVGSGRGHSVLEVLAAVEKAVGAPIRATMAAPRDGDPAIAVAAVDSIAAAVGWRARRDLDEIVACQSGPLGAELLTASVRSATTSK